eukprot:gene17483-19920_t
MHFVFGSNKKDRDFLTQQCRLVEQSTPNRQLKVRSDQVAHENKAVQYKCPIYEIESHYQSLATNGTNPNVAAMKSSSLLFEFNALYTANCTGNYFGMGPTCRCQESMRFYNQDSSMKRAEWFMFMDDDIHVRPFALQAMLTGLSNPLFATNTSTLSASNDNGMALVGSNRYRSFDFSRKSPPHSCRESIAYEFPFAQPAIINRAAMQRMHNGIEANGLTSLQLEWGGTHDALLGMFLWIYDIPTYSLNSSYVGGAFLMDRGKIMRGRGQFRNDYLPNQHFMFHRVSNFKVYRHDAVEKKYHYKFTFAGQYDIVQMLGDESLYNRPEHTATCLKSPLSCTDNLISAQRENQTQVGQKGVAKLHKMHESYIHKTTFAPKAKNIHNVYETFRATDLLNMNTPNANRIHTFKRQPVHSASTGKKAAVVNVSKWKRTHLNAVSLEEKQDIETKVKAVINARAKVGNDIVAGFNSVMRLIQSDRAAVVCVAQDGLQSMLKVLVEATQARGIPTITIPKLNQSMRSIMSLRSVSCFSLKKPDTDGEENEPIATDEQTSDNEVDRHHTSAIVDDLREYLLSLQ